MWNVIATAGNAVSVRRFNLSLDEALTAVHGFKDFQRRYKGNQRIGKRLLMTYWHIEPAGETIVIDRLPLPVLYKEAALTH